MHVKNYCITRRNLYLVDTSMCPVPCICFHLSDAGAPTKDFVCPMNCPSMGLRGTHPKSLSRIGIGVATLQVQGVATFLGAPGVSTSKTLGHPRRKLLLYAQRMYKRSRGTSLGIDTLRGTHCTPWDPLMQE